MDKCESEVIAEDRAAQLTTRTIAAIFFGIGLAVAWWVWPAGAIDLPLSQITLGAFVRVLVSGVIALTFLWMAILLWI